VAAADLHHGRLVAGDVAAAVAGSVVTVVAGQAPKAELKTLSPT
jgi:hypothetical protein